MDEPISRTDEYLSFVLDGELYAVNVSRVEVVLEMQPITRVPRSPSYLRGVTNHRGSVVPVADLRMKFGMQPSELKEGTSIIILQINHEGDYMTVGMLADGVREVVNLDPQLTEKPPKLGNRLNAAVIEGIAKKGDDFVVLLNIDEVFRMDILNMAEPSETEH
jgi:purine-binding chemotaxis protein CheW